MGVRLRPLYPESFLVNFRNTIAANYVNTWTFGINGLPTDCRDLFIEWFCFKMPLVRVDLDIALTKGITVSGEDIILKRLW